MSVATSKLGRDAFAAFKAAIQAVEPESLVRQVLEKEPPAATRIVLIAVGKAAAAMARGADAALGQRIKHGLVLAPHALTGSAPGRFEVRGGGHPLPDASGEAAADAIRDLASGLGGDDLLLVLISGGGSALMTLPAEGLTLEDLQITTRLLLRAGADIHELNAVRKHLDALKGGRLARLAGPARVLGLILSDVIGDPLDTIASGPISPDPTTFADVRGILERRAIWLELPAAVRQRIEAGCAGHVEESPKAFDPCFATVETQVIGNNARAAAAAAKELESRGYRTFLLTTRLEGEAREVGAGLARAALELRSLIAAPFALLAAGETTVTVTGQGRGGRNQELALGAAATVANHAGIVIASLGTDGIDGPTDAAGSWVDGTTRARAQDLDPAAALADNDAYTFFSALGDLIQTGPTGTNVMDLALALVDSAHVQV